MPYIPMWNRRSLDPFIDAVPVRGATAGEMAYVFTRLTLRWLREGFAGYSERALAVGVLETAKLELYRRNIGPYEDAKRDANGDVYGQAEEDSPRGVSSWAEVPRDAPPNESTV